MSRLIFALLLSLGGLLGSCASTTPRFDPDTIIWPCCWQRYEQAVIQSEPLSEPVELLLVIVFQRDSYAIYVMDPLQQKLASIEHERGSTVYWQNPKIDAALPLPMLQLAVLADFGEANAFSDSPDFSLEVLGENKRNLYYKGRLLLFLEPVAKSSPQRQLTFLGRDLTIKITSLQKIVFKNDQ